VYICVSSDFALDQFAHEFEALAASSRLDAGAGRYSVIQNYRDVLHPLEP